MRKVSPLAISAPGLYDIWPDRAGEDVQPEHGVGLRIVEDALLQHQLRAALFAGRRAFLRGLEDEHHGAGQVGLHAGEHLGDAHQDRHVVVVAARVHDADLAAVPLRRRLRGERAGRPARRRAARPCRRAARRPGRACHRAARRRRRCARRRSSPRGRAPSGARRRSSPCGTRGCRVPGAGAGRAATRRPCR